MALEPRKLDGAATGRQTPIRMIQEKTSPVVMSAVSGAPLLPYGMPVALNTSTGEYVPFTQGGSNGTNVIKGFIVDGQGVQTHASNEVKAEILIQGEVHVDDINTAAFRALCGGTPTEANLLAALSASSLRDAGIIVRGVTPA